jgi:hypothetical protein
MQESQLFGALVLTSRWTIWGDVSKRFQRVMANTNFETREKLAHLLVNKVTLYRNKALVEGSIPVLQSDALSLASQ